MKFSLAEQIEWAKSQFRPTSGLIVPLVVITMNPIRRGSKILVDFLIGSWAGKAAVEAHSEHFQAIDTRVTDFVVLLHAVVAALLLNFVMLGSTESVAGSIFFHAYFVMRITIIVAHALMNGLLIRHRAAGTHNQGKVYSLERTVLLGIVNYMEVTILFAALYVAHSVEWFTKIGHPSYITAWQDAVYFSGVTQLTIGYGDISPQDSTGKLVVLGHAFLGLLLLVLSVGRIMSSLAVVKDIQPIQIEEIQP